MEGFEAAYWVADKLLATVFLELLMGGRGPAKAVGWHGIRKKNKAICGEVHVDRGGPCDVFAGKRSTGFVSWLCSS